MRRNLKPWRVKKARVGGVYHPREQPDYMYVVVAIANDRVRFLMLLSNTTFSRAQPGCLVDESLEDLEHSLRAGLVLRCA